MHPEQRGVLKIKNTACSTKENSRDEWIILSETVCWY